MSEELRSSNKSTIDRSLPKAPGAVRAAAGLMSRLAPETTAMLAEKLFLRAPRHPRPARERLWLEGAERLTFESFGETVAGWSWGRGPVVLLVHGWGGRGSQMGAFAAPLVARGYRAVAFDAPGHGESAGTYSSLPEMAAAVTAVGREFLRVRGIVAHSAGAAAVTAALKDGLEVERCVYLAPPTDWAYFRRQFGEALGLTAGVAERMQRRIEKRYATPWTKMNAAALARTLRDTELLVLHDVEDAIVPFAGGEELAAAWPGARLEPTEGLGHQAILRDPAVVSRAVEFLTAAAPRAEHAAAGSGTAYEATATLL
jgi:pimeloyl-ACP methyl ester carboxylesterase